MAHSSRNIAVIGLGSFGSSVACELTRFGDQVLGIDCSDELVARYADTLYRAVIADGRNERAMSEVGLGDYDVVVVAIGSELESSVLSVMNARLAGVEEIWAKADTITHARVLKSIGVERILQPEIQFGEHIAHMLHNARIKEYLRIAPRLFLATIRVGERHAGTRLEELSLIERCELRCLGLVRNEQYLGYAGREVLAAGDTLLVAGTREHMRTFAEKL